MSRVFSLLVRSMNLSFVLRHMHFNILQICLHLKCECWHFHMKPFEYIYVRAKVRKCRTGKNPVDFKEISVVFVGHRWSHLVSVCCVTGFLLV